MKRYLPLVFLVCAMPAPAQAIKPGLWEIKQQTQLDPKRQAQMDQAQAAIANLPPEQKKMMEQMMAQRGVQLDGISGGGVTLKVCISKEQAEKNMAPVAAQVKGKCQSNTQRNGNLIHTRFTCTDPATEGDTEVTLNGGSSFSSKTRIIRGKESFGSSGEGRWLSSDCGALQPVGTPSSAAR
ncbi:MAG TPA: DUF3617 domain-containing protein [Burkholderiaceae bacterium]